MTCITHPLNFVMSSSKAEDFQQTLIWRPSSYLGASQIERATPGFSRCLKLCHSFLRLLEWREEKRTLSRRKWYEEGILVGSISMLSLLTLCVSMPLLQNSYCFRSRSGIIHYPKFTSMAKLNCAYSHLDTSVLRSGHSVHLLLSYIDILLLPFTIHPSAAGITWNPLLIMLFSFLLIFKNHRTQVAFNLSDNFTFSQNPFQLKPSPIVSQFSNIRCFL